MKKKFIYLLLFLLVFGSCSVPKPHFDAVLSHHNVPAKVDFLNNTIGGDSFLWSFGDTTSSTDIHPNHTYYHSGRYKITLEVKQKNKSKKYHSEIVLFPPTDCLILMSTTVGDMVIQLYDETPLHRDNFLSLVHSNFYENISFHRVIKGFMIQAGDPKSKGTNNLPDEPSERYNNTIKSEIIDTLVHIKGALAAARISDEEVNPTKASSATQFYIVQGHPITEEQLEHYGHEKNLTYPDSIASLYKKYGGAPALDKEYTVFGRVIDGIEVIDKIANSPTNSKDRPINDIKILKVELLR